MVSQETVVSARPTSAVRSGTAMALLSACTFASSGPLARSLIDIGWSSGAAVLVRIAGAAVVLVASVLVVHRGLPRLPAGAVRTLLVYGSVAVAGAQLAFFNAVRTLDVGVALLLEFLAPVLLLGWTAARSRRWPRPATLGGAAMTLVGLAFVLDVVGGAESREAIDLGGMTWGLVAAVCLAVFFVLSERGQGELPPLVMAAGGTLVGGSVLGVAGLIGVVPLAFVADEVVLAGTAMPWWVPAALLIVVSTVIAYLAGIGAVVRLRTRVASFVALTEVLFAVLLAWLLVDQLPGVWQLVGGVCIVGGIVVIRRQERPVNPTVADGPLPG